MADFNRMISAGSVDAARRSAKSPSSSALNWRWRARSNACRMTLACSSGGKPSIFSISLTLAGAESNFKPSLWHDLNAVEFIRPIGCVIEEKGGRAGGGDDRADGD